jgi:hypothetical protein
VWIQIVGDGFGDSAQTTVPEMEVFKDQLFVATAPTTGAGLAKLWRSSTGEVGSWVNDAVFSPPLVGDRSIHSFGTTDLSGGYIWLGTGSQAAGGAIYRSQDGVNWIAVCERGFGEITRTGLSPHMVVFQGSGDTEPYLYAGMGSHGVGAAAQVWRAPYETSDPDAWEMLVDFTVEDPDITTITYFYEWNATLYFGTNAGGRLWRTTDGTTFTIDSGVGAGFGDNDNRVISSLVAFDNKLYATTTNPTGGELWYTADGATWMPVTQDAFGKGAAVSELRSLRTSFGKVWLTAYTDLEISQGTPIWESQDGLIFVQSNEDGFGDANNKGENAVTIGFGDYQYFGGPNYVVGGQLWRLRQAE